MKFTAIHSKMARAALGLGVRELADLAKVSPDTIARLERGEKLKDRTLEAVQQTLEAAGVEFTNGGQPGVRIKRLQPYRVVSVKNRTVTIANDGHMWVFTFPEGYVSGDVPCLVTWRDGIEPADPLITRSALTAAIEEAMRRHMLHP